MEMRVRALQHVQWSGFLIGLALALQTLCEIGYGWFKYWFGKQGVAVPPVLYFLSFILLGLAIYIQHKQTPFLSRRVWQIVAIGLLLACAGRGLFEGWRSINMSLENPPQYWNDGTALDTHAAYLLLDGRNPYTDSRMVDIAHRFPIRSEWTTPLRKGEFTGRVDYPAPEEIDHVFTRGLARGEMPEFEANVSYPSLSFLLLVPFAYFNISNVLILSLLCYALIVVIGCYFIHPQLRWLLIIIGIADVPMWSSVIGGNSDIFCYFFLILSWLLSDRRYWSPVLFGLACATKQIAWFFAPFYLILVWRRYGWRVALSHMAITLVLFLLCNLPFILWEPQAWLAGIATPLADPMFPAGVGIVAWSFAHVIPYAPSWFYTGSEALAMVLALCCYYRWCRSYPELVMLLAVAPLFFAWRSLPSYFACIGLALFILLAARVTRQLREKVADTVQPSEPVLEAL